MQFLASYYWQQGGINNTSLVLQQAYHKRRKLPVLLAGVGQEGTDGFAGELVDWFYGEGLVLCGKYGERNLEKIASYFQDFVSGGIRSGMTGILCVGSGFVVFQYGGEKIRMLNTRNGHVSCQKMDLGKGNEGSIFFRTGRIQSGVSLVLATKAFYEAVSDDMLTDYLQNQWQKQERQTIVQMEPLGKYVEELGKKQLGAIYIEAVDENMNRKHS